MKKLKFLILLLLVNGAFSQEFLLSGIVKDSLEVLPGATIWNKTSYIGVGTDIDGKFSIKAKINDTIFITHIGKIEYKLKVENNNFLTIVLKNGPTIEGVIPYVPPRRINRSIINEPTTAVIEQQINSKTIYILSGWASVTTEKEINFSKKYNVQFHDFGCIHPENIEEYEQLNWITFDYLKKTFGKKWRKEINPNTLGYQSWLKK